MCFSTTALKWPLSCEGEDQKCSPNKPFPQNLPRTPTSTWSQCSGSHTVLPPIGKPVMDKEPELCLGQSVNTSYPIHTSSSDGYLVQMKKQKQLRARVTYKVGEPVSFICVLKGGILSVHIVFPCCSTVIFVLHQCGIVFLKQSVCLQCHPIWDVTQKTPLVICLEW